MFERILLATDMSECSSAATRVAVDLAKKMDSSLTLVHIYEPPSYVYAGVGLVQVDLVTPIVDAAERQLEKELEKVRSEFPSVKSVLRMGVPAEGILAVAEELKADLVVVGTHGRRGPSRFFLGSVAERVVRFAKVPVLTYRTPTVA